MHKTKWLKLGTMERPYPLQNRHFEAKVKIIKTKGKTTLEPN